MDIIVTVMGDLTHDMTKLASYAHSTLEIKPKQGAQPDHSCLRGALLNALGAKRADPLCHWFKPFRDR